VSGSVALNSRSIPVDQKLERNEATDNLQTDLIWPGFFGKLGAFQLGLQSGPHGLPYLKH